MKAFRIVILAVVLLAVLSWAIYLKLGQAQRTIATKQEAVQYQVQSAIARQPAVPASSLPAAAEGWGRDPFAGSLTQASGAAQSGAGVASNASDLAGAGITSPLIFHGTWTSSKGRVALIGEEAASVGDSVQGWRVVRIGDNSVELKQGDQKQILNLRGDQP